MGVDVQMQTGKEGMMEDGFGLRWWKKRGGLPTASLSCSLSGGALAVEVPSLRTCGRTSLMGLKKEGQSAKR